MKIFSKNKTNSARGVIKNYQADFNVVQEPEVSTTGDDSDENEVQVGRRGGRVKGKSDNRMQYGDAKAQVVSSKNTNQTALTGKLKMLSVQKSKLKVGLADLGLLVEILPVSGTFITYTSVQSQTRNEGTVQLNNAEEYTLRFTMVPSTSKLKSTKAIMKTVVDEEEVDAQETKFRLEETSDDICCYSAPWAFQLPDVKSRKSQIEILMEFTVVGLGIVKVPIPVESPVQAKSQGIPLKAIQYEFTKTAWNELEPRSIEFIADKNFDPQNMPTVPAPRPIVPPPRKKFLALISQKPEPKNPAVTGGSLAVRPAFGMFASTLPLADPRVVAKDQKRLNKFLAKTPQAPGSSFRRQSPALDQMPVSYSETSGYSPSVEAAKQKKRSKAEKDFYTERASGSETEEGTAAAKKKGKAKAMGQREEVEIELQDMDSYVPSARQDPKMQAKVGKQRGPPTSMFENGMVKPVVQQQPESSSMRLFACFAPGISKKKKSSQKYLAGSPYAYNK